MSNRAQRRQQQREDAKKEAKQKRRPENEPYGPFYVSYAEYNRIQAYLKTLKKP